MPAEINLMYLKYEFLNRPILLFGLPRSGTTWIGKIFDSHPTTLYRHEPDSEYRGHGLSLAPPLSHFDRNKEKLASFFDEAINLRSVKVCTKLPVFPKSYHGSLRNIVRKSMINGSIISSRFCTDIKIPDLIAAPELQNVRLVWKSIESVGRFGSLLSLSNQISGILILRNPCGYISSTLRGEARSKFGDSSPASDDYGVFESFLDFEGATRRGLTLDSLKSLTPIERLAWRWVLFNEKAIFEFEGMTNSLAIRYEDVCEAPLEETRKMFSFSGLAMNTQTRDFISQSTHRDKKGYYSVYKDPLKAANRWKDELSKEEIAQIRNIALQSPVGKYYEDDLAV